MIKELLRRYKAGVHPCMLLTLIHIYYEPEIKVYYDGDHVNPWYGTYLHPSGHPSPVGGQWINIRHWSYDELCKSFVDLNDEEKELLRKYMYGEFRSNK